MSSSIFVPNSLRNAGSEIREAIATPTNNLSKAKFIRAWSSVAYLFPGLHPDGYDDPESGWPRVLHRFAIEAWRRADAGELADEELYPCDAQWSGLYDRMHTHTEEEMERRLQIATKSSEQSDA